MSICLDLVASYWNFTPLVPDLASHAGEPSDPVPDLLLWLSLLCLSDIANLLS